MIGATGIHSSGRPNSLFASGVFRNSYAKPTQQVPSPWA